MPADEILIASFQEHRLLQVPDIYGYLPGFTPPPLLLSFADRLDALGLDVETIATPHAELSSVSELRDHGGAGARRIRVNLKNGLSGKHPTKI